jgi:hypothetical protein
MKLLLFLNYDIIKSDHVIIFANKKTGQKIHYISNFSFLFLDNDNDNAEDKDEFKDVWKNWDGIYFFDDESHKSIPLDILKTTFKKPIILLESKRVILNFFQEKDLRYETYETEKGPSLLEYCYNINTAKVSVFDSFHLVKEHEKFDDFISLISFANPTLEIPL